MAKYRILSLDGGGSWALIQVKALIDLYSKTGDGTDVTGHQVLKDFDMVVGNSGGTITIGGLLTNRTLSDLLHFFLDETARKSVFVRASIFKDPAAHALNLFGFGPKYDTTAKLKGLKALLQATGELMVSQLTALVQKSFAGSAPEFVFCTFDYDSNREIFFRSNQASLAAASGPQRDTTLALAIHASSNAPVNFFDAPAQGMQAHRYWDGAIGGYNNPVLAGVMEALANGTRREDIVALSLGTANVFLPPQTNAPHEDPHLVQPRGDSNIAADLLKLATSIVDDPPDAASFQAHMMLGGRLPPSTTPIDGPIVRMNPLIQPLPGTDAPWVPPGGYDDTSFKAIADLDMDAVENDEVLQIVKLCEGWLKDQVPNQGVRTNRDTLQVDIGHRLHSQARAGWLAIR